MPSKVPALLSLAALSLASLPAVAIEGRYAVEGKNPGQGAAYKGEAAVKKTGDTFTVAWRIGESQMAGTGIRVGDQLTVIYGAMNGPSRPGLVVFTIKDDKIAQGVWTELGGQALGTERWEASDQL